LIDIIHSSPKTSRFRCIKNSKTTFIMSMDPIIILWLRKKCQGCLDFSGHHGTEGKKTYNIQYQKVQEYLQRSTPKWDETRVKRDNIPRSSFLKSL
jgi:hypothetical protein